MISLKIVRFSLFSQIGLEDAGGGRKKKTTQITSLIFIFLKPLVQQCAGEEASPDSVDLEVWPILLQFAVVRVHGEKLGNKNKQKKNKKNFQIPNLETSGLLNEIFGKFNNFERCLSV